VRDRSTGSSPDDFDWIAPQGGVGGDQRNSFGDALSDEQTIKGIAMVVGEGKQLENVGGFDSQNELNDE
jgi:hypothetical protein